MKKIGFLTALLMALFMAFTVTAYAEDIESVGIRLEGELPKAGQTIDDNSFNVYSTSGGFRVIDSSWIANSGKWAAGDIPTIYISLEANGNGIFTRTDSGYFNVSGMQAKYSTCYCDLEGDPQYLQLSVTLPKISGGSQKDYDLDPPEDLYWSGNTAKWDAVSDASKYEVKLYRGNSSVTTVTTASRSYSFTGNMTVKGDYYFKVRASRGSQHGDWSWESDYRYVDEAQAQKNKNNQDPVNPVNPVNPVGPQGPSAGTVTYSQWWRSDANGIWHVYNRYGALVTNCWLCDDAVAANGKNIWYLIDAQGNMVAAGLVKDALGNYYSIETNHNGYYGMMRYQSGTYNAISLQLDPNHNGRFGAINNVDAINALAAIYGVTDISNISTTCVYTSQF